MNEEKSFETLGAPEIPVAKRKKSRSKNQKIFIIALVAAIVLLGVGVGVISSIISRADVYLYSFSESKKDANGEKTNYVYRSKRSADGVITIVNENDAPLDAAYADADGNLSDKSSSGRTPVYVTAIGSLLTLSDAGKISYFARVDYYGEAIGGDAGDRLLVFPRVKTEDIAKITVVNEKGGYTVLNNNGTPMLEGYDGVSVDRSAAGVLFSLSGYTLTLKKLSIDVMKSIDAERADEEGYTRIIGDDGNINFAEYGLAGGETYYEITDLSGKVYRLYIGDAAPDESGIYVRYYDAEEGDRNAVYKLSDDAGIGSMLKVTASRSALYKGTPEELAYPQITYPSTSTESAMVGGFKLEKANGDGFETIIAFSYMPLEERQYTFYQYEPYIVDGGLLSGYELDDDVVSEILLNFSDLSTLMSSDYADTVVKNYVRVVKLTPNVFDGIEYPDDDAYDNFEDYYRAYTDLLISTVDAAAGELSELLGEYGLASPAYRCFYNNEKYSNGVLYPYIPNYIYISEKTARNTYYVWAPLYQQIVEIGDNYLRMLNYLETTDWAGSYVYRKNVLYCDSFEIKGVDADGVYHDYVFDLENSANVTSKTEFVPDYEYSTVSGGRYTTKVVRASDGDKKISVSLKLDYIGISLDENGQKTESTLSYSEDIVSSLSASTVKNFAKSLNGSSFYGTMSVSERGSFMSRLCNICKSYDSETASEYLDSYLQSGYFSSLSQDDKNRICGYIKNSASTFVSDYPPTMMSNGIAVVHVVTVAGDEYGYVPSKEYLLLFSYNQSTDKLRLTVGSTTGSSAATVFDEETFENYIALSISNDGAAPGLTTSQKASVESFRAAITQLTSTTDVIRLREYDENGEIISSRTFEPTSTGEGDNYVSAFKKFYQTLLYATYPGHAGVEEIIGGKYLTEEEMAAFEASDDFDLELTIKMTLDGKEYRFRMYGYSATKSFVTVNGEGIFYLYTTRVEKLMSDAEKAFSGDDNISPTETY